MIDPVDAAKISDSNHKTPAASAQQLAVSPEIGGLNRKISKAAGPNPVLLSSAPRSGVNGVFNSQGLQRGSNNGEEIDAAAEQVGIQNNG